MGQHPTIDADRIRADNPLHEIASQYGVPLKRDGKEWRACCPFHKESTPSFTIFAGKSGAEQYYCFGCGAHGDVIDFVEEWDGIDFRAACGVLTNGKVPHNPQARQTATQPVSDPYAGWEIRPVPVASIAERFIAGTRTGPIQNPKRGRPCSYVPSLVHPYHDPAGRLLGYVLRIDIGSSKITPQIVWMRDPAGREGWSHGSFPEPRPLYGLADLLASPEAQVLVVEGEKCRDAAKIALAGFPVVPVSWAGGGKATGKTDWGTLKARKIVIWPDNDEAGLSAGQLLGKLAIAAGATSVHCLHLRDLDKPKGWDVADAIAEGMDAQAIIAFAKNRKEVMPHPAVPAGENPAAGPDRESAPRPASASTTSEAKTKGGALPDQKPVKPVPATPKSLRFSAEDLNLMRFDPIKYVVPGIIVEGLTLFTGKPKVGKSWMLLQAAMAVARGSETLGGIACEEGDVLYCALEDNKRRLQSRVTKLFGTDDWPHRLEFQCEMPRLTVGGLEHIINWCKSVDNPRMVIIDTLAMVRPPNKKDQSTYDADYAAVVSLRDLAVELHIAIILVHHSRKAEADDALDTISGTLGLTGAPDTILVLKREAGTKFTLHGRGRDIEEIEKAAEFNGDTCVWTITGDADQARTSGERGTIIGAIETAGEPIGPNEIAIETKMKAVNVRYHLAKMVKDGLLEKVGYGKYRKLTLTPHTSTHTQYKDL